MAIQLSNTDEVIVAAGFRGSGAELTAFPAFVPLKSTDNIFLKVTDLGTESLTDGAMAATTKWAGANGFSDTIAGAATYTHNASGGTLTQANADLAVAGVNNRWYRFTYTVGAVTPGTLAGTITDAFAAEATAIPLTAGTHSVDFLSATDAATADFVLSVTSTAGGTFTLDNLSLKEIIGGDMYFGGTVSAKGYVSGKGSAGLTGDVNNGAITLHVENGLIVGTTP